MTNYRLFLHDKPIQITMKAILFTKYGSPDYLRFQEIETPIPKEDEVLIKVNAASINSWDWELIHGKPFINRILFGIFKPRKMIMGIDIAGIVEKIGENVTTIKPGDEIYGDLSTNGWGAFAEYVCVKESSIAIKSSRMTYEEAAALPQAGILALQAIRTKRKIKPGEKVLINGAGGGAGTIALQLAKQEGAEVTCVDNASKLTALKKMGADHVLDYKKEDFTETPNCYDLIIDVMAHHTIKDYKRALKPGGNLVIVGGSMSLIFKILLFGRLIYRLSGKHIELLIHKPNLGLNTLNELYESGKIRPIIDKTFPLNQVIDAYKYFGNSTFIGNVVINVAD